MIVKFNDYDFSLVIDHTHDSDYGIMARSHYNVTLLYDNNKAFLLADINTPRSQDHNWELVTETAVCFMSLTEDDTDIDLSYLSDEFKEWLDNDSNRDDLSIVCSAMTDNDYFTEQLSESIMIIYLD